MWPAVLFGKRKRRGNRATHAPLMPGHSVSQAGLYHITEDIMRKGSVIVRQGKEVRQYGLSFKGMVRLVTSGDVVDRETYDALLAAGAISPIGSTASPDSPLPDSSPAPIKEPEVEE
jgi:hypothetical protein